jgi:hypothetical protein
MVLRSCARWAGNGSINGNGHDPLPMNYHVQRLLTTEKPLPEPCLIMGQQIGNVQGVVARASIIKKFYYIILHTTPRSCPPLNHNLPKIY